MQSSDSLLDDVCCNDRQRAAAALQAAHGRGEELIPGIIARLESVLVNPPAWCGDGGHTPAFLLCLAAEFRATAAHALITRILRLDDDTVSTLLGDVLTEAGDLALADTYPGDPTALLELIEDSEAGEYERGTGLLALAILWKRGQYPRANLLALMEKLAGNLDPERGSDSMTANQLVEAAVCAQASEIRDTIMGLFKRGLINEFDSDPEYAEESLRPDAPAPEMDRLRMTIDNAWAHLDQRGFLNTGWPMIHEGTPDEPVPVTAPWTPSPLDPPTPYRAPPKVGRNDPCPCGSGKKFKKCCGG